MFLSCGAYQLVEVGISRCHTFQYAESTADVMVTSTPLSEGDLRGTLLAIKPTTVETQSKPAIIRINLEYDGKKEPFVYPVDQCNWYFVCY